jgi:hypothetical protein
MLHQDKEAYSIVDGKAAAEETEASMPGESHYFIHDLIQFQVEGTFSRGQASQNQIFWPSRGLINKRYCSSDPKTVKTA